MSNDFPYENAPVKVTFMVCWAEKGAQGLPGLFIVHKECGGMVLFDPRPSGGLGLRVMECQCGYLIGSTPENIANLFSAANGQRAVTIQYIGEHSQPVKVVFEPMPSKIKRTYLRQGFRALLRVRRLEVAGQKFADEVGETRGQFKSIKLQYAREDFERVLKNGGI